jgi:hypothetical protein
VNGASSIQQLLIWIIWKTAILLTSLPSTSI